MAQIIFWAIPYSPFSQRLKTMRYKNRFKHRDKNAEYKCIPNPNDRTSFIVVKVSKTQDGGAYEGPDLDVYELARQLRKTRKYQNWRAMVLRVRGHKCEKCGCEHSLDVHHKWKLINCLKELGLTKLAQAIDCKRLWKLKRGVVLCVECHSKEHPELKGKYFEARIEKQTQLDNAILLLQ